MWFQPVDFSGARIKADSADAIGNTALLPGDQSNY